MANKKTMTVTVILKDFSEQFYAGFGSIKGFLTMSDAEKFESCKRLHNEKRASMKIGNGQFNQQVEFNQMLRVAHTLEFKLEPRRGYKLATFLFTQ